MRNCNAEKDTDRSYEELQRVFTTVVTKILNHEPLTKNYWREANRIILPSIS